MWAEASYWDNYKLAGYQRTRGENKERGGYRDMVMKRVIQWAVILSVIVCFSPAFAQYEEEAYIEGYVGGNFTLPMGYMKNDLIPDSINATGGIGLDVGAGYYFNSNMIIGLYYNLRNMGTENIDLNHRVYEVGAYGKYLFSDISEVNLSPYAKFSAGLNFSKLVTRIESESGPQYRELSYAPTMAAGLAIGVHYKTNEYGAIYFEGAFNFDFTDGVKGDHKGVDYSWEDNNTYLVFKVGVLFNIGPRE
jgi:hypothetical protein